MQPPQGPPGRDSTSRFEGSSLSGLSLQDHQVLAQRIWILEQANRDRLSQDEFLREQATNFCRIAPSVEALHDLCQAWEFAQRTPGGPGVLVSLWTFALALIEVGAISLFF